MKKATFIKKISGMNGDARLYKCEPAFISYDWFDEKEKSYDYVVVSGVDNEVICETYIFPANEMGDVVDWGELEGSFQGGVDHARALAGAGYEISKRRKK